MKPMFSWVCRVTPRCLALGCFLVCALGAVDLVEPHSTQDYAAGSNIQAYGYVESGTYAMTDSFTAKYENYGTGAASATHNLTPYVYVDDNGNPDPNIDPDLPDEQDFALNYVGIWSVTLRQIGAAQQIKSSDNENGSVIVP